MLEGLIPTSGNLIRSGSGGSAPSRRKRGVSRFGHLMASGGRNEDPTSRQGIEDPKRRKRKTRYPEDSNDDRIDLDIGTGGFSTPPGGALANVVPRSQMRGETGTGEDSWASYGTVPSILGALLRKRKKVLGGSNLQATGTLGGTTMRNTGDV